MMANSTKTRFTLSFLFLLLFGATGFSSNLSSKNAAVALPPTYCSASAIGSSEYIANVSFNGIGNISGASQYTDFTGVVFNALRGSNNTVVIQIGDFFYADRGYMWVDWNQDGDFDDTAETISVSGVGAGPYNATINVPATAVLGNTRMRIRLTDSLDLGSCGDDGWGEVEDYTINVLQAPYCTASSTNTTSIFEYISGVTFNGVTNTSAKTNYSDFTATIFNAVVGSINSITINLTNSYPLNQGKVWVDWNRDSDFNDANESIPLTNFIGAGPYSGTINVPENATGGPTRMRIRMFDSTEGGSHDSCGTTPYGEVEDYTINVLGRRYVKQGGTGDGLSWATASGDLQAMINDVPTGSEVWVAAGSYQPMAGQSFSMKENVKIYGGFPATGNPAMADRDYNTNVTQLLGNGSRVITNSNNGLTNLAVLDGFTVANGVVTGTGNHGGGIMNLNSYPKLQNCIFKNNSSADRGGALYNEVGYTTKVINCLFYNNMALYGGASFDIGGADTHYINCTFSNNTADYGGALLTTANSNIMAYNCIFWGNTATTTANEIYLPGSTADIFNCLINVTPQNVAGGSNFTQTNTISGNPQFVNAPAGNYTLKSSSPAINTGSNTYFTNVATAKDLANNPRLYNNATIDIGAYEYQGLADCSVTTTWSGTAWSNGTPISNEYAAVIAGNYSSTGNITACSLTVTSGTAVVNTGHNFIIKGAVAVNGGSLTFEDDANLVQEDDVANNGNITYKRNSNALHYLDYTLWSSPVTGTQKLKEFSAGTLDERFYVYNTTANAFSNYTSASGIFGSNPNAVTFAEAKGYLIRMPAGLSTTETSVFNGEFTGIPNNGNTSIALGTGGNRFNAVGNPYPSPINIFNLIDANNTQLDNGTIYLWRKTNNSANTTYATVTKLAYNANTDDGGDVAGSFTGSPSDWVLQAGQGFFVKAATTATSLSFTNSMRRAVNTGPFFRMAQDEDDTTHDVAMSRLWLDINNTTGAFGQTVIGYTDATTKQLDYGWDGRLLNDGEISLYSIAENTKLAIQARDAFAATDVVPIGYKATAAGNMTISLSSKDGLFLDGQNIYLLDKLTNTTNDMIQSAYTFTTEAGTFDERFDVVYANSTLGIDKPASTDAGIVVYKNDNKLHITSTTNLEDIKVYDMRGRLLYSADALHATQHTISNLNIAQQPIIIKIKTDNGIVYTCKTLY